MSVHHDQREFLLKHLEYTRPKGKRADGPIVLEQDTIPCNIMPSSISDPPVDDCLLWLWGLGANGAGVFSVGGVSLYAHRQAYMDMVGPIPPGMNVYHFCGRRFCIQPTHLYTAQIGEVVRRYHHT